MIKTFQMKQQMDLKKDIVSSNKNKNNDARSLFYKK